MKLPIDRGYPATPLWQINAEVPANVPLGPAVPMTLTADGITSNTVTIAVE